MKESGLHEPTKRWILTSYPKAFFYKTNDRSTDGIPDILASCDGLFVGLELKENHVLTPIQRAVLIKISRSGGIGLVIKKKQVGSVHDFDIDKQAFVGKCYEYKTTPLKEVIRELRS